MLLPVKHTIFFSDKIFKPQKKKSAVNKCILFSLKPKKILDIWYYVYEDYSNKAYRLQRLTAKKIMKHFKIQIIKQNFLDNTMDNANVLLNKAIKN